MIHRDLEQICCTVVSELGWFRQTHYERRALDQNSDCHQTQHQNGHQDPNPSAATTTLWRWSDDGRRRRDQQWGRCIFHRQPKPTPPIRNEQASNPQNRSPRGERNERNEGRSGTPAAGHTATGIPPIGGLIVGSANLIPRQRPSAALTSTRAMTVHAVIAKFIARGLSTRWLALRISRPTTLPAAS